MAILPITTEGAPGVYIREFEYGRVPAAIADHSTMYVLGYSEDVDIEHDKLYWVTSVADFDNLAGVCDSQAAVDLFFKQRPETGFYFVSVKPRTERGFTVTLGAVGSVYTITVDGFGVSVTGVENDSVATVSQKLLDKFNKAASHLATGVKVGTEYRLRLRNSTSVVTATSNITLAAASATPSYPKAQDVLDTASTVLLDDLRQGFIVAPEFYQNFTSQAEWALLANGLDVLCQTDSRKWVNIVDSMGTTATLTTGGGAINAIQADRALLQSPAGHTALYFPYWVDGNGSQVPPSTSVVAVAIKRYRVNFSEPPAGTTFPIFGVTGLTVPINNADQSILNPLGINCLRNFTQANLSSRKGTVIYGARTVSTSPFWRFVTTRVIANILEGTLRNAFDSFIFTTVDGQGEAFNRIKQTADSICERMRQAKAFYGKTADEAYLVVCDDRNNPLLDLENGTIAVDVFFKPSPVLERLIIRCHRTSLDTVITESFANSNQGSTSEDKPATAPSESGSSTGSSGQ